MLLIFSVNTIWVIALKDKKGITITNAFQKILKSEDITNSKLYDKLPI